MKELVNNINNIKNNFLSRVKKTTKQGWILIILILLGIFLRTYNFHDWLRFSMDQSRDAMLISNVVEGKSSLPLLGPLAGGTFFHLGPAYYYFSIFSAKIFGNYPDKMAYPSLFFSILTVPLLYFFSREYFNSKISLIITALMSVSYFAVANSRFSSNPNLAPFFVLVFLYSTFKLASNKKSFFWWSVAVGISLGVGIQIHTTLLVIIPAFLIFFFLYLIKKKQLIAVKSLLLVLIIFLIFNTPQIINAFQSKGANTRNFLSGLQNKKSEKSKLLKSSFWITVCQMKANSYFLTSTKVNKKCVGKFNLNQGAKKLYKNTKNKKVRKIMFLSNIIFIVVFSLGGYYLLGYYFFKEKGKRKKYLGNIIGFNVLALFFLTPVVSDINVNYFIILLFIPFILFGLWLKFLNEKLGKVGKIIILIASLLFFANSLRVINQTYNFYRQGLDNNQDNSDLREIEEITDFIIKKAPPQKIIYLSGKKAYLKRFFRPLAYLVGQQERKLFLLDNHKIKGVKLKGIFFYIQDGKKGNVNRNRFINGYPVLSVKRINKIEIYEVWKN